MSGGEPSSIKQFSRCAARVPAPSKECECRAKVTFDFEVYGLILRLILSLIFERSGFYASGIISQVAPQDL